LRGNVRICSRTTIEGFRSCSQIGTSCKIIHVIIAAA
jgi:hypothetical protein